MTQAEAMRALLGASAGTTGKDVLYFLIRPISHQMLRAT